MAHELAHGIARHHAEKNSWQSMINLMVFGIMAQTRIGLLPIILTTGILCSIIHRFAVGVWLSQLQEHEADVLGVAISQAAGYNVDDAVAQHAHQRLWERTWSNESPFGCPTAVMDTLQLMMPALPDEVDDSNSLQLVMKAVHAELSTSSLIDMCMALKQVIVLWLSVV